MPGHSPSARHRRPGVGQHELANHRLAAQLVADAKVSGEDRVVDLGAGSGILTAALASHAAQVLAVELDGRLARRLARRFAATPRVTVLHADARTAPLPATPYRVVANLPFQATSAVLRRLLDPGGGLLRADVVVQSEVARARTRSGPRLDLLAVSWSPWWGFERGRRLPARLFRPTPSVDGAVLIVTRREPPLLEPETWGAYCDFVRRGFGHRDVGEFLREDVSARRAADLARQLRIAADVPPPQVGIREWIQLFRAARQRPKPRTRVARARR